jgi:hypothetical protein
MGTPCAAHSSGGFSVRLPSTPRLSQTRNKGRQKNKVETRERVAQARRLRAAKYGLVWSVKLLRLLLLLAPFYA